MTDFPCGSKAAWLAPNGHWTNVSCSLDPHDDRDHEAHLTGQSRGQQQPTEIVVRWTRPSEEASSQTTL